MRTTNNNKKKMVKIYKTPQSNNRGIKLMSMSNNRIARVINNNRMIKMMKIYKISKKVTLTNSQFSHKRKEITAITKIAITTIRDNPNNN